MGRPTRFKQFQILFRSYPYEIVAGADWTEGTGSDEIDSAKADSYGTDIDAIAVDVDLTGADYTALLAKVGATAALATGSHNINSTSEPTTTGVITAGPHNQILFGDPSGDSIALVFDSLPTVIGTVGLSTGEAYEVYGRVFIEADKPTGAATVAANHARIVFFVKDNNGLEVFLAAGGSVGDGIILSAPQITALAARFVGGFHMSWPSVVRMHEQSAYDTLVGTSGFHDTASDMPDIAQWIADHYVEQVITPANLTTQDGDTAANVQLTLADNAIFALGVTVYVNNEPYKGANQVSGAPGTARSFNIQGDDIAWHETDAGFRLEATDHVMVAYFKA